jgi:hypothetical protein
MAFGDTRSIEIDEKHTMYVASLEPQVRQLIELRDTLHHGSWDTLEDRLPSEKRGAIHVLKTYEKEHHVNLGLYLKIYLQQQKSKKPA